MWAHLLAGLFLRAQAVLFVLLLVICVRLSHGNGYTHMLRIPRGALAWMLAFLKPGLLAGWRNLLCLRGWWGAGGSNTVGQLASGGEDHRLPRPPLQEPTAEVPGGSLEETQAPLDAGQGQLEVVHFPVLVRGCEVVCTEGAEQQSQEEVQDLWKQQTRLSKAGAMLWHSASVCDGETEAWGP